ncbi:MAG: DUF1573 domain-containing protein [Bacteroidetes bacterium]|nr:DUF1573 domain-containing protein [Bacteroidota bacterium]
MKQVFLLLFFFIPFTLTVSAQSADGVELPDPGGPEFDFEEEIFDFGNIQAGSKVTHEFKFTNTGGAPLIIIECTAPCGCTIPTFPKEPIIQGNGGVIKVVFDSKGRSSTFHKTITITSNASTPTKMLHIKGTIVVSDGDDSKQSGSAGGK